ncbi:hypothetical protein [Noviherbaspirillum pedocola]|uniref:Uncharacterized protein n=1 Tax=Noviherbaspirillum pedocola TaxID=2801341 RepID=A0A934T049_9BURK|nr:hypothetical protein [Noviherbaspirillum pedocola]MBK4735989.1 hypothetical protein [Noviherbaspirillum pedocola]
MHQYKPQDRVKLRESIRESSEYSSRESLYGAKGDVVVVRSVSAAQYRYPIEVAHAEADGDPFFVAAEEIEPLAR